ncbi:Oidioi.mRNA.OKI2018_I69.chr2.g6481.t3.cds [Oikopleura dioica]|uniref:Oidioi.mRNA.OKI2018_I69.chr2.g6481.t3.cds n=1 Tax=Oikopleura dioica TaxID=34765 RepID=A0ABN7T3L5_OIKDI|nr:Oidioi.mRNA.OKI2018_I69.chr2.g6481.t3.cds [Oikopleura dioica]
MGGTELPESQAQLLQSGKLDEREKQLLDDTTSGSDESNSNRGNITDYNHKFDHSRPDQATNCLMMT